MRPRGRAGTRVVEAGRAQKGREAVPFWAGKREEGGEPGPCWPWGLLGLRERTGGRAGLLVLGWGKGEWAMGRFGLCAGLGLDMSFLFFFSSSISISNSN